jgi:hypothetical protein
MPLRNETVYEPVPSLRFNTSPPDLDFIKGQVFWDENNGTLAFHKQSGDQEVTQQIGQEIHVLAWNDTGGTIPNGSICYPTGSNAYRPTAGLAQADDITTARARGIATEAIEKNTLGFITTFGLVRDFDTQTPDWSEGDFLYLSADTPGGLTNTPPTSGYCVRCAYVLRRHPEKGIIFFRGEGLPAFGNISGGNYTDFEYDGTMKAVGDARTWRDELQPLTSVRLTSPSSDLQQNDSEVTVTAETSARYPTDFLSTNVQINHDWALGTSVHPHLHWKQDQAATPNWLLAYRWQKQGSAWTSDWTLLPWDENIFTYESGSLNQITDFPAITPPEGYGEVSDIVQFKLYRDFDNDSGEFGDTDQVNADVEMVQFDVHLVTDTLGSRLEYSK